MKHSKLNKAEWAVRDVDLAVAQALVADYHYARGGSLTRVYTHGLFYLPYEEFFETEECVGVAWWLPPTRVTCESVNRAEWKRVLGLSRFVLAPWLPRNAASFLLAKSEAKIRRDGRFVSLVTYADESQGHTGTIYSAANWTYEGRTKPNARWIDPVTGRQVATQATKTRTKQQMVELGYVNTGSFSKHKFVKHLKPLPKKGWLGEFF